MATPIITVADVTVDESLPYVEFLVKLSEPSTQPVSVTYNEGNGVANYNTDYVYTGPQTLTFAAGETQKLVRVNLRADTTAETNESFFLELSSPTNATIGNTLATATIVDNDAPTGTPLVSVSDPVVDEQAGTASFTISLSKPSSSVVTMKYATENGNATAGSDYTAASGTLTFAAGQMTKTVTVSLLNDSLAEGSETFGLRLSSLVNATAPDPVGTATIVANDAARVSVPVITVDDVTVGEGQGYADFVVRLNAPSNAPVSVNYNEGNGIANYNTDYVYTGVQTLTFAAGEMAKTVRISLRDDATAEKTDGFFLELSSATGATIGKTLAAATIVDNDAPSGKPIVSISDFVVDEQAREATFFITLDKPSTSVVTMSYATENGGALAGSDYVATSGTIAFAPGEMVHAVKVALINDTVAEASESFNLRLSSVVNASVLDSAGTAVIGENDAARSNAPVISVSDETVGEGQGFVDFVVRLSAPSDNPVSVDYNQGNGTGDYNNDYVYTGVQSLTFAAGETVKTVRVYLRDDAVAEPTQNFFLELSSPVNASIGNTQATATIIDNDAVSGTPLVSVSDFVVDEQAKEATFIITLNKPSTSVVSMSYATENAGATAGSDYVATSGSLSFAPGEVAHTVKVSLINDSVAELSEAFNLRLSGLVNATSLDPVGTAVIAENDATRVVSPVITVGDVTVDEGQTYADFVVRLSAPSNSVVSVNYNESNGTGDYNNDYVYTGVQTLNFAAGETVKTVRVSLRDDATPEPAQNFFLDLSSPVNATIGNSQATANIIDNDAPSGTPVVSINDFVIDEKAREATFVVTLDRPSTGVVSMSYATENGTAIAGSDYTAATGTIAFAPGEVTHSVKISLVDDSTAEQSETFGVRLANVVGATAPDPLGRAIIYSNDAPAVLNPLISVADVTVGEGQTYADFVVRLSAPSTSVVSVDYNEGNGSGDYNNDYVYGGVQTLNFAAGETVKTVRVSLRDDTAAETAQNFFLQLSSAVGGTIGNTQASATIIDNDAPSIGTPVVSIADPTVDERAGIVNFAIALDRPSASAITLSYTTVAGTAAAGSDFTAVSGTVSFAPGQTVANVGVPVINDTSTEGAERFALKLTGPVTGDLTGTAVIAGSDAASVLTPSISSSSVVVGENAGFAEFQVRLSAPSASLVSVNYVEGNGTADYNNDYVYTGVETLTFAPGETTKVVKIGLRDDSVAEADESFSLNLSGATNATLSTSSVTATILDNDTHAVYAKGLSDDSYTLASAADRIIEVTNGGTDTVNIGSSYTLGTYLENLTLTGSSAINGTGNTANNVLTGNSAVNTLTGLAGNDTLDGRGGADKMIGGTGDDIYKVDNTGDVVTEAASQGTDRVDASVSFTLSANVENLTLGGTTGLSGTGNDLGNTIIGNSAGNVLSGLGGNDTLRGGLGNDTLTGGLGLDRFVFSTPLNAANNVDTVTDFTPGQDTFVLANTVFTALGTTNGPLDAASFHAAAGATTAADASDRIIYNTTTGDLYYDSDGSGGTAAVLFAKLTTHPALTAASFTVEPPPA